MKLPRYTATTPPPTETGLVRAQDIGALTNTGDAQYRAIAGAGRALQDASVLMFDIQQRKQKISDDTQTDKISQNIQIWAGEQEEALEKTLIETPEDAKKALAAFQASYNKMLNQEKEGASIGVKRNVDSLSTQIFPRLYNRAREITSAKFVDYTIVTETDMARAEAGSGDIEAADRRIDKLYENGIIGPKRAAAEKAKNQVVMVEGAIENIKPVLISAIGDNNNKDDGYKALAESLKQLVDNNVLSETEAAEADKVLGDWMDNYVAGRIKATKEADKQLTREIYAKLSEPIIDGKLTYDDIDNSDLLKSDKELWKTYIKGSYKDAPTENTPQGHDISFNAVYDAATLQLSPKEAYDIILNARFVDRSITNDQFKWAIEKIDKPYPKDVLENLSVVTASNLQGESEIDGEVYGYNRLWRLDKKRNMLVNESLITWVDRQIGDGKIPTKKEMYAMSSQFHVGNDRWYDIGDVIDRGGKEWEVIGFDENGSAVVEEVR